MGRLSQSRGGISDVPLTLGSLFDGIAGFPLAASRCGIATKWASEIELFPIKVSQKHFPNMKHLGNVTRVNGAEIEPVDIITFGSPCQDMSVAGKRAGINGSRSGLFMDAVRIIAEMRKATNGAYPRFAIWENVPGVFSSNEGRDFRAVLEALTETEVPMPQSGKWATAGMVRGNGREIAWRLLDAQYWGVPQRRKRIFLVADFRGERAGEILFEREGMFGDFTESGETGKEVAADAGDGAQKSNTEYLTGWDNQEKRIFGVNGVSPTLSGSDGGGGRTVAGYLFAPEPSESRTNIHPKISGTLCASGAGMSRPAGMGSETDLLVCQPAIVLSDQGGSRMDVGKGVCPTLRAQTHNHEPIITFAGRQEPISSNVAGTLDTSHYQSQCVAYPDPANTLLAKANMAHRGDVDNVVVQNPVRIGYAVRRLTPTETLRLQGFPDQWLDIEGTSDSAKYKVVGNSVAVPCVEFIFRQMVKVLTT